MRAVYWSCMAIVSVVFADAAGCGGRVMVADCGDGRQYCSETNVCCPNFTICGDGNNGCPAGDCCLNTTSHVVDGGSNDANDSALAPGELPPPEPGGSDPSDPSPGGLPGNGGGGGGGGTTPVGGYTRS
jgi:hypothetical protein